jgi:hypothetical protein
MNSLIELNKQTKIAGRIRIYVFFITDNEMGYRVWAPLGVLHTVTVGNISLIQNLRQCYAICDR